MSLWLYRKIGVSTLSQNLIHFAIRCNRENIWVLWLNITDSEKNIIVYFAVWGRNWIFHVESNVSNMGRRRVPYTSHEMKVQFRPLAVYHIFHDTDTYSPFCLCKWRGIERHRLFSNFFFFRIRIRIMTRIRISLWNSFEKVILHILKIHTKFGVAPQIFCENQNSVQDQDQDHDFTLDFNTRPTFHT